MNFASIWLAILLFVSLTLAPAMGSSAQAGSINYEGISSVSVDEGYNIGQHRGLMLNFSFGGPKDYKRKKSMQEMQKANLDSEKLEAYGVLAIAIGIGILTWTD